MFIGDNGKYYSGKGIEEQIRDNPAETDSNITLEDFEAVMQSIMTPNIAGPKTLIAITGFSGWCRIYLNLSWCKYGTQKLPRKLKKKVYLTKKLRQQYLPEYYGK